MVVWCASFAASGVAMGGVASSAPILVLGDSLSAAHNIPQKDGWVYLLRNRLADIGPDHPVINASISGETSAGGRARLQTLLDEHHPMIVVIELGANDGLRGLPLDALRDNLDAMIVAAQTSGAKVLLLGIELPVNYGPRYRDELRAVYTDLAARHRIALVPFLLDGIALDPALMQDDGLHPTAAAQPRVLDNVWSTLQPLL